MTRFTHGLSGYIVFAFGQLFSLTGSGMTQFALGIWLWNQTGSSTAYAITAFLAFAPRLILAPLAGAVIDRVPRKAVLFVSDFAQGLGTVALLLWYLAGSLTIWHVYALVTVLGVFAAFQAPAASTVVSSMVPKQHYTRANGLRALVDSGANMLSPIMAGALLGLSDGNLQLVFTIDLITMSIALILLLVVHIPNPAKTSSERLSDDMAFGFRFFRQHRGLLAITLGIAALSLFANAGFTVLGPLILSRTGGSELAYGTVSSAIGFGGIIGGSLVSVLGDRLRGMRIFGCSLLAAALAIASMGLVGTVLGWMITGAAVFVAMPMVNAMISSIFQRKVPAEMQGRVFAAQGMIITTGTVFSMLAAGPLADFVFEPGMNGGRLQPIFGALIGTGPGTGMSLMLFLGGVLSAIGILVMMQVRSVRTLEEDIPDVEHALAP